jgi:hypothetical protein
MDDTDLLRFPTSGSRTAAIGEIRVLFTVGNALKSRSMLIVLPGYVSAWVAVGVPGCVSIPSRRVFRQSAAIGNRSCDRKELL